MKDNIPNNKKIILDLCGGTGSWSLPYKEAGYDVRIITLPDYDILKTDFVNDKLIQFHGASDVYCGVEVSEVYGILAAPPCTQFSFARTTARTARDLEGGMEIVEMCLRIIWFCQYNLESKNAKDTSLKFWALENPVGLMKRFLGHPVMIFNPWMWGDMYQKPTCLWGYFNKPELEVREYMVSRADKLNLRKLPELPKGYKSPVESVMKSRRGMTPKGFAEAFFRSNK